MGSLGDLEVVGDLSLTENFPKVQVGSWGPRGSSKRTKHSPSEAGAVVACAVAGAEHNWAEVGRTTENSITESGSYSISVN